MYNLLPIGSVIKVKNNPNKYIIVGTRVRHDNKFFDYACMDYPTGYVEFFEFDYFNDSDIEFLCFLGNVNK